MVLCSGTLCQVVATIDGPPVATERDSSHMMPLHEEVPEKSARGKERKQENVLLPASLVADGAVVSCP
jgi:hypothetical protein